MRNIKIKIEKDILLYQFNERTMAGITFKNAGNYNSADKIFSNDILQYFQLYGLSSLRKRLITVYSSNINGKTIFIKEGLSAPQTLAEGIIYRGIGGVIFFPAGCPIIIFCNENSNLSGIIHAGWKSIGAGIIDNFIDLWKKHEGHQNETKIQILPAMCGKCLDFYQQDYSRLVIPAIKHLISQKSISQFTKYHKGKISMDLPRLIEYFLNQKGYKSIEKPHECVCCSGKYWCYRCDDKDGKKYRNAAFIITAPFAINEVVGQFAW